MKEGKKMNASVAIQVLPKVATVPKEFTKGLKNFNKKSMKFSFQNLWIQEQQNV